MREWIRQRVLPAALPPVSYDDMLAPPESVLDAHGDYIPGWWTRAPDGLGVSASSASSRRLHRWFFAHFDTEQFFVGFNIIDLALGGNSGVVILDKQTGAFSVQSATGLLHRNGVRISDDHRAFRDQRTGSCIAIDTTEEVLEFDVSAHGYRVVGRARALFERPFVQCTAFHRGHGTLQSWGNLLLEEAEITWDGRSVKLPGGCYGAYDRSFGHRRPLEAWNWLVAVGEARRVSDDARVPFSVHLARDRERARPQSDSQKFALWVDDSFGKLQDVTFDYRVLDARTRATTSWHVASRSSSEGTIDLIFEPEHIRRDVHRVPLVLDVDHLQYFGAVKGEISLHGERYLVEDVFATAEDSRMVI